MNLSKIALTAALLAGSFSSLAAAASTSTTFVVPFAFSVNGKQLPAGKYTVSEGVGQGVIFLRSKDTAAIVATRPEAGVPTAKPAMVFNRDGSRASLVRVRTDVIGSRAVPSHEEVRLR